MSGFNNAGTDLTSLFVGYNSSNEVTGAYTFTGDNIFSGSNSFQTNSATFDNTIFARKGVYIPFFNFPRTNLNQHLRIYGDENTFYSYIDYYNVLEIRWLSNGGKRVQINANGDLNATGNITGANASSDERIKIKITEVVPSEIIESFRKLRPVTYNYKDGDRTYTYKDGEKQETRYGFIAQEVENLIPFCIYQVNEKLPNILEMVSIKGNILTHETFDTNNYERDENGNLFEELFLYNGSNVKNPKIVKIINNTTCEISESLDGKWNCYGQVVNNFRKIEKEAIFTITTSVVQYLDKKVTELESQNKTLEDRVQALESKMSALLEKLN